MTLEERRQLDKAGKYLIQLVLKIQSVSHQPGIQSTKYSIHIHKISGLA